MKIKEQTTKNLAKLLLGFSALIPGLSIAGEFTQPLTPFLPAQVHVVSTVPENGDGNPYGVAFVPRGFPAGTIKPQDILVSNFNNNQGMQGKGSTIVSISSNDTPTLFFQGVGFLGLTTALNVLKKGFVLVGSFPSTDGTCGTATNGSIFVINNNGQQIQLLEDPDFINGPWDSTLVDKGDTAQLYIANALSGTVVRFNLTVDSTGITVLSKTIIASGYQHQCDPVTFVDAPTGLVYSRKNDVLYVASTMDNKIYAVHHASTTDHSHGKGKVIYADNNHLHGPLAMMMAPNGDLVVSNNDAINPNPSNFSALTEFTPNGVFVKDITIDPALGAAFGLAQKTIEHETRFAAVNDNQNNIFIWKFKSNN